MRQASTGKSKEIAVVVPPLPIQQCNISIPEEDEVTQQYFDGRKIHRVPRHLLKSESKEEKYTPKMVSFGPYHHGLPHLCAAEDYKQEIVDMFVLESGQPREVFYNRIFKVIDQVRNCYVGVTIDKYDDNKLANMMLQDACFAIYLIQLSLQTDIEKLIFFKHQFGLTAMYAYADMILLENQIPFWIVNLLLDLLYANKEERSELLYKFTYSMRFAFPPGPPGTIHDFDTQPFHFLDALRQLCIESENSQGKNSIQPVSKRQWVSILRSQSCLRPQNVQEGTHQVAFEDHSHQFRSVTELKAKGISFRPSSFFFRDIKFKSFTWHGEIQLPVLFLSEFSPQIFANITAYEASAPTDLDYTTINYVNFLKSLIVKPEDAKELREKKIFFSSLNSDKEVWEIIKDIDTWGFDTSLFNDVKREIENHCDSKRRTWMAELIHTHFRSPWSAIALLAATSLLCLSVVQAYYAMNPKNSDPAFAT